MVKSGVKAGIVNLAIGLLLVLAGSLIVSLLGIAFGILLVIKGVSDLLKALKGKNLLEILFTILTIIVGIMLIVSKWLVVDWFFIVVGVMFIIDGVLGLLGISKTPAKKR